ncbi:aldehyde oxidase GLOX1 [Cajanus cajan]|uniref:aldehyde oxidase GLOX1 n=1 Tax=Cajanus cajan TaxID=3821 RepID=UPI00098DA288|nr:aldehyde oxidase GLOX1 [Cajanus cajan]
MAPLHHKVVLFLTLLFLAADAQPRFHRTIPFPASAVEEAKVVLQHMKGKPDFETDYMGNWDLINPNSGVSAMHVNLMPTNKVIVYDTNVYRTSRLQYPNGMPCVTFFDQNLKKDVPDCFAHAMEYDIETNQVRALTVKTDPWCSCGGLSPDGTLIVAGGFADGGKTSRYYGGPPNCQNCDWREYPNKFLEERWYATQIILPNGEFIVIGGRRAFSYEFFPKESAPSSRSYFFPFLYETSDIDENNLYPFVHLITDGNLFVFANNRSLLLNPNTNKVIRTYPILPGGSRNYPASGMSAILPIKLQGTELNSTSIKIEVIVCGGNTYDGFHQAETKKIFLPALKDCGRMVVTDPNAQWVTEEMPSGRCMGDCLVLPNGQLLFINGAQKGTAAWWDADDPNFTPVLYWPEKPNGQRFKVLTPSTIARMYHSSSAVLPSGKIWVGGSNPHDTYKDVDKFPTETRVEAFSPPYLDPAMDKVRPQIVEESSEKNLTYGVNFETQFKIQDMNQSLTKRDIKVTLYFPPFTTHGYSMNQRLLVLTALTLTTSQGIYTVTSKAPPFREVAPPGHYLLFVVHRRIPGKAMWVHIE